LVDFNVYNTGIPLRVIDGQIYSRPKWGPGAQARAAWGLWVTDCKSYINKRKKGNIEL